MLEVRLRVCKGLIWLIDQLGFWVLISASHSGVGNYVPSVERAVVSNGIILCRFVGASKLCSYKGYGAIG